MLRVLTTNAIAARFSALDDKTAKDVATVFDVIERLGPGQAPPGSRAERLWKAVLGRPSARCGARH